MNFMEYKKKYTKQCIIGYKYRDNYQFNFFFENAINIVAKCGSLG